MLIMILKGKISQHNHNYLLGFLFSLDIFHWHSLYENTSEVIYIESLKATLESAFCTRSPLHQHLYMHTYTHTQTHISLNTYNKLYFHFNNIDFLQRNNALDWVYGENIVILCDVCNFL